MLKNVTFISNSYYSIYGEINMFEIIEQNEHGATIRIEQNLGISFYDDIVQILTRSDEVSLEVKTLKLSDLLKLIENVKGFEGKITTGLRTISKTKPYTNISSIAIMLPDEDVKKFLKQWK
jgi:hypothetical protein